MDSAIGFAKDAICCMLGLLCRQIDHLTRLSDDVGQLQNLLNDVNATKIDIRNWLEREAREALAVVTNWMNEVDDNAEIVAQIRRDYHLHKRCLFACCPHCVFRLRLSRRVRDRILILQSLSQVGKFESLGGQFGDVPLRTQLLPAAELLGQTPQRAQAVIQGWLAHGQTRIIGIHGIGGVGKTSLVENINNNPQLKPRFDVVIFVTVSENAHLRTVQDSIAARLGLALPESADERRIRLFDSLQRKRYLLILDDLWATMDLRSLGVGKPSPQSGSRIVLTTRDRRICLSMGADQIYELNTLPRDEVWDLFRREARLGDGRTPPTIEDLARRLAAHCDGLPLAIHCIATAVRGYENDIQRWEYAWSQLQSVDDAFCRGLPHMKTLKLSYDFLQPHLKLCFLDCALYRTYRQFQSLSSKHYSLYLTDEVIEAEYSLIPMWIAEGLLAGRSSDELYGRGHDFINMMRDHGLLQTIRSDGTGRCGWVKVHDVLKDVAIQIGKEEKTCFYAGGDTVTDFPFREAEIVGCQRISVLHTQMVSLPTDFKCETLISLVLARNKGLEQIPVGIPANLPSLKVLDLRGTNIKSLPSSLGLLKQLVYLDLSQTKIEELPESTGELTCLQFLLLPGCSELTSLPSRICECKSLKVLVLTRCQKLGLLRHEISQLTSLETFYLGGSNIFIGEMEMGMNEICLQDLRNLNCLKSLSLQLKSPITNETMERWMNLRELTLDCRHTNQQDLPENMQRMAQLELFHLRFCNTVRLPDWICGFTTLGFVQLVRCLQLTELPELHRLPSLRTLSLIRCRLVGELKVGGGFPMLEHLYLSNLPSLESVVGRCLGGAMANLQRLSVFECPKFRRLPRGMERLPKLEIRGTQCWWDSIIWEEGGMRDGLQKSFVEWAD